MAGDMVNNLMVPLAGWTVPRPVFKRTEIVAPAPQYPVALADLKSHLRISHTSDDGYLTTLIRTATAVAERFTSRRFVSTMVRMWMDFIPGTGNEYTLYGAGTAQVPVRYANIGMFRWFELLESPVASVDSINFIANDGSNNVFDPSQYIVDNVDHNTAARIILQRGTVWPVDLQVAHSLNVNYTIGYGLVTSPAWTPSTAYAVGQTVTNGVYCYRCTVTGTSGTVQISGNAVTTVDGSVSWAFMGALGIPPEISHAVMIAAAALWSNRGDDADPQAALLAMPNVINLLSPFRVLSCGVM